MWVVKLGGSLSGAFELPRWLDVIGRCGGGRAAVVPGGGPFADSVRSAQRQWGFSDVTAHRMAILAMRQYGEMLAGLCPGLQPASSPRQVRDVLRRCGTPIWLPDIALLDRAGIPATWEITSDSLAAWLAREVPGRGLALVKSVPVAEAHGSWAELADRGVVDRAFPGFVAEGDFMTVIYGRGDYGHFEASLASNEGGMPALRHAVPAAEAR